MTGKAGLCILFGLFIAFGLETTAWAQESSAANGQRFARKECRLCHVIGPENKYGGVGLTPSFYIFAENWERYEERLSSYYVRNPHPAYLKKPSPQDHDNLMAYVKQLKRPKKTD